MSNKALANFLYYYLVIVGGFLLITSGACFYNTHNSIVYSTLPYLYVSYIADGFSAIAGFLCIYAGSRLTTILSSTIVGNSVAQAPSSPRLWRPMSTAPRHRVLRLMARAATATAEIEVVGMYSESDNVWRDTPFCNNIPTVIIPSGWLPLNRDEQMFPEVSPTPS